MAKLLPSLFVLLLHSCSGHVEDADVSGSCENVGADGKCSGKTDRVELMQTSRHSSLKAQQAAALAECGSLPAFSAAACPEDKVCTYTEDKDGMTFTLERAGSVAKMTFGSGHNLYMADGSLMLSSPCHGGETIKAGADDTTSHATACSDNTIRDVGPDAMVQLTATAHGIDVFEADMGGHSPLQDHVEMTGSSPRNGAIVLPSDVTHVSREEFADRLAQISQGCPSLVESKSVVTSLDGAVSKKWNPGQWVGALTMAVGGVMMLATFAGCGPPCFAAGLTVMNIGGQTYYRSR